MCQPIERAGRRAEAPLNFLQALLAILTIGLVTAVVIVFLKGNFRREYIDPAGTVARDTLCR